MREANGSVFLTNLLMLVMMTGGEAEALFCFGALAAICG
jgi:hypothetical protein